jgi:membrane-associated phospholipid phosphatase
MADSSQSPMEQMKREVQRVHRPWYELSRVARWLFLCYAIQLAIFALLAWWVHVTPVNAVDVAITQELQENQSSWFKILMLIVSYPGNSFLQTAFVLVAAGLFWFVDLRLEAIFIVALSAVSALLNVVLKVLVSRPRPSQSLVEVFQAATGKSFPSGHVMAYLALWGLLFSFGILLFRGRHWWRIALLVISALFVVLVGPSRIYLGDHWATDVLGSYLIGGVLLGISLWIYLQLKQRGVLVKAPGVTRNWLRTFDE